MTKVAYLVSDYSAPSHTFVRREIGALRDAGVDVVAYSIQPVGDADRSTVKAALGLGPLAYLAAFLAALLAAPGRFFAAWLLALKHRPPGLRALVWSQFHFLEATVIARYLREDAVSRLHVHFANSGATVAMLAARLCGIKFSMTLHGISETDFPAGFLLADKVERADFVACASNFMRAQAMRSVDHCHWSKLHIVRCGVTIAEPAPGIRTTGEGAPKLVCVGRLSPEKGYHGLFEALSGVQATGQDFSLRIVGDGPGREELLRYARSQGIDRRTAFLGYLPEQQTLAEIAGADVLVLASLMEGLPVVLIEAMMLGKPVIAPRVSGIPELVEEQVHGLLFTPSDWQDLQRTLEECLARRADWAAWGDNGIERVREDFSITVSAARMSALLTGPQPS